MKLWRSIERKARKLKILDNPELDLIKGDNLMSILGETKHGKWVGDALRKIRDAQYSNKFNTFETATEWVQKNRAELSPVRKQS